MPASPAPRAVKISATNFVGVGTSPFTAESQTQEWPGEYLQLSVTMPPIRNQITAGQWEAFFLALRGASGTFYMGDPSRSAPLGIATGTPVLNGTQAAGSKTLSVKGWTASTANILRAGDWVGLLSGTTYRLHKILTNASSNGSGVAILDIFPRLREIHYDSESIVLTNPVGTWRLANNVRSWDIDEALFYGFSFDAIEAL